MIPFSGASRARRINMAITFQPSAYSGLVDQGKTAWSAARSSSTPTSTPRSRTGFSPAPGCSSATRARCPKPGDFFVSSMGEESVILCRDRQGEVHVFLNSCMHRGMKVCRYDEGNTPIFTCPYHGWSFATDGALVGVPFLQGRLPRGTGQVPVGPDPRAQDGQLQGRYLGDVGPQRARLFGIHRRLPHLLGHPV